MTLQEMFIDLKYRYDGSGAKKASGDLGGLKSAAEGVGNALDNLGGKLAALSAAATAGAVGSTIAYTRWSSSMVELAGKAGLTLKQFKELTKESGRINRYTGAGGHVTREMMQRAFSLGADRRVAQNLARYAGILHSTKQAEGRDAVEAAMALQGSGLGPASSNLQMTHAASQVGGGNVPDYFKAAATLAGSAGPAGVKLPDLLAMLTIGSRGGSLSGAAAGIDQFLLAIKREPEKRRGEFYRERTGKDWTNLDDIQQRQGIVALVKHISENFTSGEIFRLFGEKEAIKTVALLASAVEDLDKNQKAIATAQERDSIGGFDKDTFKEISRAFSRFREAWNEFWKAYGEPFAKLFNPILKTFTGILNSLTSLNALMGGLLAWLPMMLTTALLFRKMLLPMLAWGLGKKAMRGIGNWFGFGGGDGRDGGRNTGPRGGRATGAGALGFAAIGAFFANLWEKTKIGMKSITDAMFGKQNKGFPKAMRLAFIPLTIALAKVVGVMLAIAGAFVLAGKALEWAAGGNTYKNRGDPQGQYFKNDGLPGGEPAPGYADIAQTNLAIASAERNKLRDIFGNALRAKLAQWSSSVTSEWIPKWLQDADRKFTGWMIGIGKWIWGLFESIGWFIRELFTNPKALVMAALAKGDTALAKGASGIYKWLLDKMGIEVPEDARALGSITEQAADSNALLPYLTLTKEQAKALGITGGDYSTLWGSGSVTGLELPTPTVPLTPQAVNNAPRVVISMGDFHLTTGAADDRFDVAKEVQEAVRSELKNSADRIIQEMDGLSP